MESLVGQHAEEAAFLWTQRAAAIHARQIGLPQLARLDQRLDAHMDGLRVAGDVGWSVCRDALPNERVGGIFALSILAFDRGAREQIEEILSVIATSSAEVKGVASALGWMPVSTAQPVIVDWLASSYSAVRRAAVAAAAAHGFQTDRLSQLLGDADPAVRARTCRSVGELGQIRFAGQLWTHLKDQDEYCRFWTAWSLGLMDGDQDALEILQNTDTRANASDRHRILAGRLDGADARAWFDTLATDPHRRWHAIKAAAALGYPHVVEWLILTMGDPSMARAAGEAFTTITGVDMHDEKLAAAEQVGSDALPTDDPADENVEMDPDENLPWPDPEKIARWWREHRGDFQNGTRYLLGRPITVEWCEQVLREGRQRQRAAAALEIAIRRPGQPLFNVAAPGFRQQEMLGIRRWPRRS